MNNSNHNFDALWSNLRDLVIEARTQKGDRPMILTDSNKRYGGNVNMWEGDEDGATLYITTERTMLNINCQPEALLSLAAQCIAAAQEVQSAVADAQAVRPKVSEAHSSLLTGVGEQRARRATSTTYATHTPSLASFHGSRH